MSYATLIHSRDPFRPLFNCSTTPICRRVRVDTLLRQQGFVAGRARRLKRKSAFVVCIGHRALMQAEWSRCIEKGDVAVVMALPRGGGNGGSNPLATVLTLALVVSSSAFLGPGALGLSGLGLTGGSLIAATAAVNLAGSMLINALLPPSSLKTNSQTASPTYSIAAQGNSARIGSAVPRLYGRFRVYPDYAAQPYTENSGNEQTLYQLFCVTQGYCDINEIRIGDTPISSFGADMQYEIVEPGVAVTLFPDNVVTSSDVTSLEAKAANEKEDTDPDNWTNVLGPFVANPSETKANYLAVDLTLPGLGYSKDDGSLTSMNITFKVEAQPINDSGVATGDWATLDDGSITMATVDTQMISKKYEVAAGRYQVRLTRTDNKSTESRANNTLIWSGLRAYLPSKRTYGNVTLLAMTITATNNLNSNNAKQLNVIATARVPVWDGTAWSDPTPTRSIAWAIADMCRSSDYGAGLPDSRFNRDELLRLDGVWSDRGETLDGVFDTTQTFWDALTSACYVGRTKPMYYAGVIDFVRDEAKTIRTAMFTPFNMLADSFEWEGSFPGPNAVDCVDVTYTDPESWQSMTVRCALADSQQKNPKAVQIICASLDQAHRLGMYMCAANRDQRQFITFKTELDGYLPKFGDLVSVSHDVMGFGQSGFVEPDTWNSEAGALRTSEPLEWTEGKTHYIAFRQRDGSRVGPFVATRGADDAEVTLSAATQAQRDALYVSDGVSEDPTFYQFGPSIETIALDCLMLQATQADDDTIELHMVNYADSVYEAESSSDTPAPPAASQLVRNPDAPIIPAVAVTMTQTPGLVLVASALAVGATSYEAQASSDGGATWQQIGVSATPRFQAQLSEGAWQIRMRAVGAYAGLWVYWTGTIATLVYIPSAPVLALQSAFVGTSVAVNITPPAGVAFYHVEVYTDEVRRHSFDTTTPQITWSVEDARNVDAVAPQTTFEVSAGNSAGLSAPASITAINTAPAKLSVAVVDNSITIEPLSAFDISKYVIKQVGAVNPDVESDTAGKFSVSFNTTFDVYATDVWGNAGEITEVSTGADPSSGGGGGGGA